MQSTGSNHSSDRILDRINIWYGLILIILAVFFVRLFYLQVIKHTYYSKAASASQLKEYEIPASRGVILAHNGDSTLPLVLNETLYTLFADPKYINNKTEAAKQVQQVIGGKQADYEQAMDQDTRYAVLAKRLSKDTKNKLDDLNIKGLGTREEPHRTYPQGSLAAQILGFVNDEGQGKYGLEQALENTLKGTPGELKAITDAKGVPLLSDPDNVIKNASDGKGVLLTVDLPLQRLLEDTLKQGLDRANSKSGSAVIIDPYSGAIKAMADFPTYKPAEFYKVKDPAVFSNQAVSSPLEVGSVMKTLTTAAALDQGVITPKSTFYDPGRYKIDDFTITNVEEVGGSGTRSVRDILQLSLNTGATWMLMQMGGGQINSKARNAWHDYMSNHYQLGKLTGVEQGYEAVGQIPDPNKGYGLNLQYANSAFGQGMSATILQMAAALSSAINGGNYYKPHLVDAYVNKDGTNKVQEPQVIKHDVVKNQVSKDLKSLMEYVISKNYMLYKFRQKPSSQYIVGGKTGTAQITKPGGGYYDNKFNGMFLGFVGGNKPQYVIAIRVNDPHIAQYAGAGAAAPIFSNLVTKLINNLYITPKSN